MRGSLAFALTALTLLFLLEGLTVLLATVHAHTYAALYPSVRGGALLVGVLPLLALLAPAAPLTRFVDRHAAIAGAAVLTAVLRVPLSVPQHEARLLMSALVVAAGAVFLSTAVGYLERRSVAGGVGAAVVLAQLLRLAGWGWDITLRSWWVGPQLVVSAAVVVIAVVWLRMPMPGPADREPSFERRAGGLRLRGAVGLAMLLFLDLNILARAEVATRWLGVHYEIATVLLVSAGTAATLLLLAGHGPVGRHRPAALMLVAVVAAAVFGARPLGGWPGVALLAAGHGAAVLLIGRVLVPAGGRRKGGALAAGLVGWMLFNAMYAVSFLAPRAGTGAGSLAGWLFATSCVLLGMVVLLLPRPIETRAPLRGRLYVALTLLVAVAAAALLAIRDQPQRPVTAAARDLRVATLNVRHGFDDELRYDPAAIADALAAVDADVVVLFAVGMLPTAYGTDLAHYLGRTLSMHVHFAAARNGLTGDAVLSRLPTVRSSSVQLPGGRALASVYLPAGADTLLIAAAGPGRALEEREALHSVLAALPGTGQVVLLTASDVIRTRGVDVLSATATDSTARYRVVTAALRLR
ncbi:hypothetical protein BH23GEM10_BH23GEM10_00530 [soil metagenome]